MLFKYIAIPDFRTWKTHHCRIIESANIAIKLIEERVICLTFRIIDDFKHEGSPPRVTFDKSHAKYRGNRAGGFLIAT